MCSGIPVSFLKFVRMGFSYLNPPYVPHVIAHRVRYTCASDRCDSVLVGVDGRSAIADNLRWQGLPVDTRRDELLCDDIETGLSRRELRESAAYTIALWEMANAAAPLTDIQHKLQSPEFALYAGRKANVLFFPCGPALVEAADVVGAFAAFDTVDEKRRKFRNAWSPDWLIKNRSRQSPLIYTDKDGIGERTVSHVEERRDIPESRAKWRFLRRSEALLRSPDPKVPTT